VIKLWKDLVQSPNEVEYQQRLQQFEQTSVGSNSFVDYVTDLVNSL